MPEEATGVEREGYLCRSDQEHPFFNIMQLGVDSFTWMLETSRAQICLKWKKQSIWEPELLSEICM